MSWFQQQKNACFFLQILEFIILICRKYHFTCLQMWY